jgi:hypothetical protein
MTDIIKKLLDNPHALESVRKLTGTELAALISQTGLEDAGAYINLASREQLEAVLDQDLWSASAAGAPEEFDDDRFAQWIEVLAEDDAGTAAGRLAEMDEDLVGFGFSRLVRVFDRNQVALAGWAAYLNQDLDDVLGANPSVEIDEWLVLSRGHEGWTELVAVLLELADQHGALFERLMRRCEEATSSSMIEAERAEHGAESVEAEVREDAAAERERRRADAGYVSPADAVAFLRLAEREEVGDDAITRAHLGTLVERATTHDETHALANGAADHALRAALAALDDELRGARQRELAYLANVLVSAGDRGRSLEPIEAAELAFEVCGLGFARGGSDLARTSLVRWFGRGWRLTRPARRTR